MQHVNNSWAIITALAPNTEDNRRGATALFNDTRDALF